MIEGASLRHGTYGVSWAPELPSFIEGWDSFPRCLGSAHRLEASKLRQGEPPESPYIVLEVSVDRSTTDSPTGAIQDRSRVHYASDADLRVRWPAGRDPTMPLGPGRDVGAGWREFGSGTRAVRMLTDEAGKQLYAEYSFEGWLLSWRSGPDFKLGLVVGHNVPVARWAAYRGRVETIFRWLTTPPAHRDNGRRLIL